MTTTNTIMAHSHFTVSVWKEMIADTLHGYSIDFSAKRLGLYHQAAFDMRHKILMALLKLPAVTDICLGEVSEFDETTPGTYRKQHFEKAANKLSED